MYGAQKGCQAFAPVSSHPIVERVRRRGFRAVRLFRQQCRLITAGFLAKGEDFRDELFLSRQGVGSSFRLEALLTLDESSQSIGFSNPEWSFLYWQVLQYSLQLLFRFSLHLRFSFT